MKVSSSQLGAGMFELLVDPEPGDKPLVVGEAYGAAWRHHYTLEDGSAAFMDCPRSGYVVVLGVEPQADGRLKLTCDRSRWAVVAASGEDRIVLSNDEIPLLKRRVNELERAVRSIATVADSSEPNTKEESHV